MNETATKPVVYKVEQVAEIIHCDLSTAYRLIKNGDLKAVRLGRVLRVTEQALNEFLGLER